MQLEQSCNLIIPVPNSSTTDMLPIDQTTIDTNDTSDSGEAQEISYMYNGKVAIIYRVCALENLNSFSCTLRQLDLVNLGLKALPEWLHDRFPHLESLNLGHNKLGNGCLHQISTMQRLQSLGLIGNEIKCLGTAIEALRNLPFLGLIDLRGNPATEEFYELKFSKSEYPVVVHQADNYLARGYLQHFRAFKGLGVWWLDGNQLSFPGKFWKNEYSPVQPGPTIWHDPVENDAAAEIAEFIVCQLWHEYERTAKITI